MKLYEAASFGGKGNAFEIGDHNCEVFKDRKINNKMISIKIPAGLTAIIYDGCFNGGISGAKYQLTGPF